jgi:hypothetical protein
MNRPTFLLIGAAKAGTTALYEALRQHPDIFLPPNKEPSYFAWQGRTLDVRGPGDRHALSPYIVTEWPAYEALFAQSGAAQARGEASTAYLYDPRAARNIQARLPTVKLVAILRQPADRAFAAYLHLVRDGREKLPFAAAVAAEPERIAAGWEQLWHYRAMGFYHRQLRHYLDCFGRERLHLIVYDDLLANAGEVVAGLYAFLGVDPDFVPTMSARTNPGGHPRHPRLYRFMAAPRLSRTVLRRIVPGPWRRGFSERLRRWPVAKPPLDPVLHADLTRAYRDDILRLQDTLERDLSAWLA